MSRWVLASRGVVCTISRVGEWMRAIVYLHQAVQRHMGIALRGRQADMTEELLNAAEIGPCIQEVCRAAMPKRMGMHTTTAASQDPVSTYRILNLSGSEPRPEAAPK